MNQGLSYNWHRHYDPSLARYTQADPIGLIAGPSRYAYVGGDPLQSVDPRGESASRVIGGIIGWDVGIPDPTDAAWPKWAAYGALAGGALAIDWLILSETAKSQKEKTPKNYPPGTIGLDKAKKKYKWTTEEAHEIKEGAIGNDAGGTDWVGVAPDGTVGINDGDGNWEPADHWKNLLP